MAFLSSLNISGSGLTASRLRMDIISENIANQTTTRTNGADGEAVPYRRKLVSLAPKMAEGEFGTVFKSKFRSTVSETPRGVQVVKISEDERDFKPVYNPEHPDANEDGYVMMPNVDPVKETIDMMAATRAYDANITAFNAIKGMATKALELGR